jgi:hypothetical protein
MLVQIKREDNEDPDPLVYSMHYAARESLLQQLAQK